MKTAAHIATSCFHCGLPCDDSIQYQQKSFCCTGCQQVFRLLQENDLCTYYQLEKGNGIQAKGKFTDGRFGYLDDPEAIQQLLQFASSSQQQVRLQLPQMHCVSCVYLLENLHQIEPGIIQSQTNFQRKEIFIRFDPAATSLRKIVELLAFIGYEPAISLQDTNQKPARRFQQQQILQIGVAGFCFANIMMLSFPEYFSGGHIEQAGLKQTFTWLILLLSFPVLFFCASGFFKAAWKGLQQKNLNIDAPIVLATLVSFGRSYYEILTHTGPGYLDSATGIIFFMLVGRWFQNKTYQSLSFERDYRSYFPLGVTTIQQGIIKNIPLSKLQVGDTILTRNLEMIPADAVLLQGDALIDYSFVSGETHPVPVLPGETIFAGGKQTGTAIELKTVKPVAQSYITDLWNNVTTGAKKNQSASFIHPWSRYFTVVLFSIALLTAVYWQWQYPPNVWPAVTAILLVACPCSLLLSATFTFGNMLRILGKRQCFLKNAQVLESMTQIDAIVFDKTGTLTNQQAAKLSYEGTPLTKKERQLIAQLANQSTHPLSKLLFAHLSPGSINAFPLDHFEEVPGQGISGKAGNLQIKMGTAEFTQHQAFYTPKTEINIAINGTYLGKFLIEFGYRNGLQKMANTLIQQGYQMHLLSGDHNGEQAHLQQVLGEHCQMHFNQRPIDKLAYIQSLQQAGYRVCMIGDGLNDAGALLQAEVGIAISDDTARFSPASDLLLAGDRLQQLPQFFQYAKNGQRIVTASFILSIAYNVVGISFAIQAKLSPMIAAILMPASSISIVLLVTCLSGIWAKKLKAVSSI